MFTLQVCFEGGISQKNPLRCNSLQVILWGREKEGDEEKKRSFFFFPQKRILWLLALLIICVEK